MANSMDTIFYTELVNLYVLGAELSAISVITIEMYPLIYNNVVPMKLGFALLLCKLLKLSF